ncbi:unnamed protein product [Peniophora sp. CBMAI 1063]|nr:unnamed protein product [Peniophora sp. CBMAI 1063]
MEKKRHTVIEGGRHRFRAPDPRLSASDPMRGLPRRIDHALAMPPVWAHLTLIGVATCGRRRRGSEGDTANVDDRRAGNSRARKSDRMVLRLSSDALDTCLAQHHLASCRSFARAYRSHP